MAETTLSRRTLAYAEELTDAILGLDARYRAESGDSVGLAVLDLTKERVPDTFATYAAARERFDALRARASKLPEPDRATYYEQFCASMLAFIEWRQEGLSLPAQVERFLHVPAAPPPADTLATLRDQLADRLNRLGYDGSLTEQCAAWKADTAVPANAAADTLTRALDRMRTTTSSTLGLPAEALTALTAAGVSAAPFNAKCDYSEAMVVINTDPQLTTPWLEKLAVHEGYPGHGMQFSLREAWYGSGAVPADSLLSVVNCASSTTFEGIADSGRALLGGTDTTARAASLLGRYQVGIATAAAWRYHEGGWSTAEITDWLTQQAVYGDEGWIANRVDFLTAPERATLMWSYWHGEPTIREVIADVDAPQSRAFLEFLYGRLHSVDSVRMYEGG